MSSSTTNSKKNPYNIYILYTLSLCAFLILDGIWLGFIAPELYQKYIGHLLTETPYWPAAIAFYLLFIGGIMYFATLPALQLRSGREALKRGALFGLMTYATYDLTNMATLPNWPLAITVIDLIWGSFLSGSVAYIGYNVTRMRPSTT